MNTCMNCHREPEEFISDEGDKCYWMVIPKGHEDNTVLFSNLELRFVVSTDREYDPQEDYFMCIKCFEASIEYEETTDPNAPTVSAEPSNVKGDANKTIGELVEALGQCVTLLRRVNEDWPLNEIDLILIKAERLLAKHKGAV
jgi:hypothetical protein